MNNSDLTSKYNNSLNGLFKDNNTGDIGANDARSLVVDIAASFINNETDYEKYVRQGTTSGTNDYTVTVSSASNIYATANLYVVHFVNASTGPVTLNVNSGGAKKVYRTSEVQADAGDVAVSSPYLLRYYTALDSGAGGFLMVAGGGGSGGSQDLLAVLTQGNDAGGYAIANLLDPTDAQDAATKAYVDTEISGVSTPGLGSVLGQSNDASGLAIINLDDPTNAQDAATKAYVDSASSGSNHLADYTPVTDAAPLALDCTNIKEPKFRTDIANSRTISLSNVRAVNNLDDYCTIYYLFKKTVSGDVVITLDASGSFTNKDLATSASATSFTLSGASNTYFHLTGIAHGESSGCIIFWNLVSLASAGSVAFASIIGAPTDNAALVSWVTGLLEGLKWKNAVKVATTTNGTLATAYENGDTVDGVTLSTGDRILLKNQTTQTENGIYTVNASGAPTRASDANIAAELEGATVTVQQGTSNANTTWTQTTDGITLGSSNIVWAQFGTSVPDADSTTKGIAKLYNTSGTNTDGAITQGAAKTADDLRVLKAGDTLTGALAMGTNKITGLAAGTASGDALRYEQMIGVQDLFIPASAMWPRVTGGCAALQRYEMSTSLFNVQALAFDGTTQEFAQFQIVLPRKYNGGSITFVPYWTAQSGSGTVQFGLSGGAYSNDDALTVAFGTAQTSDDTLITTNDLHAGAESSGVTIAGTPADADFIGMQISRNPASDTLTADALLLGVSIRITIDAGVDA